MNTTVHIENPYGSISVFLDPAGDHIVTRHLSNKAGEHWDAPVAWYLPDWDAAVRRAAVGSAFL